MRYRRAVILASIVAVAGLGVGLARRGGPTSETRSLGLAAPPAGREVVFRVSWHEKSTTRMSAGAGLPDALAGELELEADLVLAREPLASSGDAVRAELRSVRASRVVVAGSDVVANDVPGRTGLEGRPVHLVVEGGRIVRVLVERDSPSLAVQLTENVARQVLLAGPQMNGDFEREEELPTGTLRVRYERRGDAFARRTVGATALNGLPERCDGRCSVRASGEGSVEFEANSAVVRLHEKREVHAGVDGAPAMYDAVTTFSAERVGASAVAATPLDEEKLATKLPGEVFESDADKRASLERLAAGATIEDVLGGLASQGAAKGWLVRSTALLELHPELINEVAIRFEDETLSTAGRTAVLDVLAATGGDAAKAALLRVLDGATAREDRERIAFVQRALLVEEPNVAMARAFRSRFESSQSAADTEMAYAEAHVLGAMAGRLAARGARAEAKASVEALGSALDKATAPAAHAAFVSALGNAGDTTQVGRVARHARDEDPAVRRAVASALRKTNDRTSRDTLLGLARDTNEEVQVAAVDALGHHPIDTGEQRELAQVLESAQLGAEAEGQLATLLLRQGPPSPAVRGSLEHLLARTEDPRLTARILLAFESSTVN
jgi:HEAT repeat protein